jgi:3-isopropylmalate dehydrogenase
VPTPIKLDPQKPLDIVVVRENTEDLYMALGGQGLGQIKTQLSAKRFLYDFSADLDLNIKPSTEVAFTLGLLTEPAITRITTKACNLAIERGESTIHIASKANALPHFYGFWDKITSKVVLSFPKLSLKRLNVDSLCYLLPRSAQDFGIILCPNLFGDIVSDLVSALAGGLGLAASANIGDNFSMFEPVHGSAPDIAGTGRANPLATILSASMMLDHLGESRAAQAVFQAVYDYLATEKEFPFELGGMATVSTVGTLVANKLKNIIKGQK